MLVKKPKKGNTLIIGDTHIPFEISNYLYFCYDIKYRCRCENVVHVGDIVDQHSISYHEHDPDGLSPKDEYESALRTMRKWFKAFPNTKICLGNHDRLPDRKRKTAGLPSIFFRPFRDVWELPCTWEDGYSFEIDGVRYIHGTGYSGQYAHVIAAVANRQSTVMGHIHSAGGVEYLANEKDCIFGMNVGCGINRHSYAMAYGRDFKKKPVIGCGVVTDFGRFAQFMPMEL